MNIPIPLVYLLVEISSVSARAAEKDIRLPHSIFCPVYPAGLRLTSSKREKALIMT